MCCPHGTDAAVVEFDTLPDTIWPTPQNHNFPALRAYRLVFLTVSGVVIGCLGLEFCSTRVNRFVGRHDAQLLPQLPHSALRNRTHHSKLRIGKAELLHSPQDRRTPLSRRLSSNMLHPRKTGFDNLLALVNEPWIVAR